MSIASLSNTRGLSETCSREGFRESEREARRSQYRSALGYAP
jgi:hypothetical protein